jgi:DNA replication protein DnaC
MLNTTTLDRLEDMRLKGMADYLRRWLADPGQQRLAPLELVGLMADAEWLQRENARLTSRLRRARLKHAATLEDIDYTGPRGFARDAIHQLQSSVWIQQNQNLIVTGPTGVGKSYLACAFGQKACRDGFTVAYHRVSRLLEQAAQARADGSLPDFYRRLAKTRLLVLDDFGLEVLSAHDRKVLLEILEDRYGSGSTIVTSQLEVENWHATIGDPTIADATLDRLVHNAHRIKLSGPSLRKTKNGLPNT